jgi:hypothetical protein
MEPFQNKNMMDAEDVSDSDVLHQVELIGDHTMIEDREGSSVERNGFIQTREESENYKQESEGIEYEQGKERIGDNTNKKSNFCPNLIKTILFCYAFISKYFVCVVHMLLHLHFKPR